MIDVHPDAAAQCFEVDEQSGHVPGKGQEEDPQAYLDLKHLPQRQDWAVTDPEPVPFFGGQIFPGLPWVQVADVCGRADSGPVLRCPRGAGDQGSCLPAPRARVTAPGKLPRVRRGGQCGTKPGADCERRRGRAQQFADGLAVYLGELDEFFMADLASALLDRDQQRAADA